MIYFLDALKAIFTVFWKCKKIFSLIICSDSFKCAFNESASIHAKGKINWAKETKV